jgi:hypothetical protein
MPKDCYLNIKIISECDNLDEKVVEIIQDSNITTQAVIWIHYLRGDRLMIRRPLLRKSNGAVLIELPEETKSGFWRIWVSPCDLVYDET